MNIYPIVLVDIYIYIYIKREGEGERESINPFLANVSILYLLSFIPPENLWFSDVFRGYKMEHWSEMG